jgi:hypothetical protein
VGTKRSTYAAASAYRDFPRRWSPRAVSPRARTTDRSSPTRAVASIRRLVTHTYRVQGPAAIVLTGLACMDARQSPDGGVIGFACGTGPVRRA